MWCRRTGRPDLGVQVGVVLLEPFLALLCGAAIFAVLLVDRLVEFGQHVSIDNERSTALDRRGSVRTSGGRVQTVAARAVNG